ncbi:glycoside hydrolase family 16 protein [Exidia glandulosa HHB12029]|uniref:Glycoside hydrolase family 16 protein n=1 Tax=Exidia glandulosa HHB12029 TaxID=1314781 RepID=A0A165ECR3_EXIGL|nr:glycoside hydrolase family 16 protein [Exidia glandulosa HHB12029]
MPRYVQLSFSSLALAAVLSCTSANAAATGHSSSPKHVARGGINPSTYRIADTYIGNNFYDGFEFWAHPDPTDGIVNYVTLSAARSKNLTHADDGSFVIRGDATRKLSGGKGRDSVRIQSNKKYTTHVQVMDLAHMPEGRGTWPAYWMTGDNWPFNGEVDIIEGANDQGPNLMSLHTGPGCLQTSANRAMKGAIKALDCNAFAAGNTGCGVFGDSRRDFGPALNAAGGGFWATERTAKTIKIWFWSRQDDRVPDDVKNGASSVNPASWGKPTATFNSNACALSSKMGPNRIIINLTFCGGFGGHTFPGGTAACEAFVKSNPEEFGNAYWQINALRVYQ